MSISDLGAISVILIGNLKMTSNGPRLYADKSRRSIRLAFPGAMKRNIHEGAIKAIGILRFNDRDKPFLDVKKVQRA
ncbi:MAG: hypothetical protein WCW31_00425 [Patescibacteria group bacterium]|jgi:hypothetical protein